MSEIVLYIAIGIFLIGGLAVQLVIIRRRHQRDYREELAAILAAHGLTFVSARWPGMFKVGPFPKFGVEVGLPQSRIGGMRGEYDEYRVVIVKDAQGNIYELWARLEFELFRLQRI